MDDESVCMIIDNVQAWADEAYTRCRASLASDLKLPGMAADMRTADQATAGQLGDVIERMIWDHAGTRHGLADKPGDLTAELFATMLGHIDWREVGKHYHATARERYAYATGVDPYP